MRPNSQVLLLFIPVKLKWLAIGVAALNVIGVLDKSGSSSTAYWIHLGGMAFSFIVVRKGWIWSDPLDDWRSRRAVKVAEQQQSDDLKLDDLLAKIHSEGMSALTKREREFLKKVSGRR